MNFLFSTGNHLRVIYNQFNNKIVDLFLDKKITSKKIKIISKI